MKKRNFALEFLVTSLLLVIISGCVKEEEQQQPNQAPTCHITTPANGQELVKGETVRISVDASDTDGNIAEIRFFVDNTQKGTGSSYPYNYNWETADERIGSHTLKALCIDNEGSSTSDEVIVTITDGGSGDAPVAEFSANLTEGNAQLTVNFTDQSTNDPTSYEWSYGDGNTSTEQNPSHTYNTPGTYTVTLTVTNNYGSDTETKTNYIIVYVSGTETFTDPRDGQLYHTIEMNTQTWFADNLNYATSNSWSYDNSSANSDVYGRLYTWDAATAACPDGWHLPGDDEWQILEMYLGMTAIQAAGTGTRGTDEGGKLKETGTSYWDAPNTLATNSSGFRALPGGYRLPDGTFMSAGKFGYWWTSTEWFDDAWFRRLDYDGGGVRRDATERESGFSVRCIKD